MLMMALAIGLLATTAQARDASLLYSLRDGPLPDGVADDLLLPADPNYARVFLSTFFDSEFHGEFIATDGSVLADVNLALTVLASDMDLVYGESKTFQISAYQGSGVAELAAFGAGTVIDTVMLPTNGTWDIDVDVTDLWNDAVLAGDDFFAIRVHDPVWTGTAVGAGTITVTGIVLEGVPEPGFLAGLAPALILLAAAGRRGCEGPDGGPWRAQRHATLVSQSRCCEVRCVSNPSWLALPEWHDACC